MNSKKIVKIILSLVFTFACLFLFQTMSQAASFSASISKTTVTVGDTFTVTVKASNAAGMYSVTNSNSNVSLSSGSKSEFLENGSTTVKFKAVKAGTVKITAEAMDMTDLDDSSKTVNGSKTFNVTIKEKSSSTTTTTPTFTSKNQTVYATSQVNVRSSYSTSSSVLGVLQVGDSVTRTGLATKSVNGILWSKVTYNGKTGYISSSYLTTTKPTDASDNENDEDDENDSTASNANLKSLTVTPTGLSPAFSAGTTEYVMTVGSNIDEINVEAVAEDENASVEITGNTDLKIGTNTITITVTAGDKTTKTYRISVTKEDTIQLQLSELLVEGLPLQPEFDSNIYEYTLTLDRSDVSEINITATPSEESAEIEILGNTDLKAGENLITILVKSEDGEETTTYQIVVTIPEGTVANEIDNQDLYLYIGIGVGVLLVLIIIIAVVRKRGRKEEDGMYYGIYESNNDSKKDVNEKTEELSDEQETENVDIEQLPKLDKEDLPKSLRNNVEDANHLEDTGRVSTLVEENKKTEKDKKIDEFYYTEDGEKTRKRGKHSK